MVRPQQLMLLLFIGLASSSLCLAHQRLDNNASATYLGNEALLVTQGQTKVLFDPFFHNDYNTYQLVPEKIRSALLKGEAPYDNIDAIFISHAHGDHFAADDVSAFLKSFPKTKLIAPQQAIDKITAIDTSNASLISIELAYQDPPISKKLESFAFDVVRIPHAGWPQRADVSNLVFRVTLEDKVTVVHMGDADPDDAHFKPLMSHWNNKKSDAAFPPYWFFTSRSGPQILDSRIQAKDNIGVHVPVKVPSDLSASGAQFFSEPGQIHYFQAAE